MTTESTDGKAVPPPKRLATPWPGATDDGRVQANLDKDVFDYFFRGVFAGDRGPRAALICLFFDKLHMQCVVEGVPAHWDEENEAKVVDIMRRLNFDEPRI